MRHLIIDTDTASDDAVALVMALMHPEVRVRAVTVVAGNVPLPTALDNALMTIERCVARGAVPVPVHAGAAAPIARPLETAQFVHGDDGMGDIGLGHANTNAAGEDAIDVLCSAPGGSDVPLTLVTLGPLTNVALALQRDPELLTRYEHTVMMAGAPDLVGNVNLRGEFNVWCDPEAAEAVFAAPGTKTMVGWNISRQYAVMTPADQAHVRTLGPLGEFVHTINRVVDDYARSHGLAGYDLPDPITMAIAIDPRVATRTSVAPVRVTLDGDDDRGASVVADDDARPAMTLVWEADESAFKAQLFTACSR